MSILNVAASLTVDEWQAVGAIGTLVVAVIAAIVALAQVRQSASLRRERSRPYVVAFVERAGVSSVDLVIKNFGLTAARDVRLRRDRSPMMRWDKAAEPVPFFENVPLLVPGQEWRTIWDFNGRRIEDDEPAYEVVVESHDTRGRRLPNERFTIGTQPFAHEMMWERNGLHELGTAVEKIEKTISRWSEGLNGLKVYSHDGDAKDDRDRARWESRRTKQPTKALREDSSGTKLSQAKVTRKSNSPADSESRTRATH